MRGIGWKLGMATLLLAGGAQGASDRFDGEYTCVAAPGLNEYQVEALGNRFGSTGELKDDAAAPTVSIAWEIIAPERAQADNRGRVRVLQSRFTDIFLRADTSVPPDGDFGDPGEACIASAEKCKVDARVDSKGRGSVRLSCKLGADLNAACSSPGSLSAEAQQALRQGFAGRKDITLDDAGNLRIGARGSACAVP